MPMVTVFHRQPDGIRHFWSSEMFDEPVEPGQDPRHAGLLEPLWNMMDLTREGRPKWDEQIQYECCNGEKAADRRPEADLITPGIAASRSRATERSDSDAESVGDPCLGVENSMPR